MTDQASATIRSVTDVTIQTAIGHLELLANHLRLHGWEVHVTIPADRWPYLYVVNPAMRALNENVTAAPDPAGVWWLWFSWGERLASAADLTGAVARLGRVLTAPIHR
jgi:hypothetical protein